MKNKIIEEYIKVLSAWSDMLEKYNCFVENEGIKSRSFYFIRTIEDAIDECQIELLLAKNSVDG